MDAKLIEQAIKDAFASLPPNPALPLKGRGYSRADFGYLQGRIITWIWEAIPSSHKDTVAYRRTGGYFGHDRVISPEAEEIRRALPAKEWKDALTISEYREKQAKLEAKRAAEKSEATKLGFRSVTAMKRHVKQLEETRATAWHQGRATAVQHVTQSDKQHADLNEYGIAPGRDRIEGDVLELVNFHCNRKHRVRLSDFMALYPQHPTKIERRNAGWKLPVFTQPVIIQFTISPKPAFAGLGHRKLA